MLNLRTDKNQIIAYIIALIIAILLSFILAFVGVFEGERPSNKIERYYKDSVFIYKLDTIRKL